MGLKITMRGAFPNLKEWTTIQYNTSLKLSYKLISWPITANFSLS